MPVRNASSGTRGIPPKSSRKTGLTGSSVGGIIRNCKTMKQFTEVSRKRVTPAVALDARWLKKAAACSHAFYRCTAIMAGSWARDGGMLKNT